MVFTNVLAIGFGKPRLNFSGHQYTLQRPSMPPQQALEVHCWTVLTSLITRVIIKRDELPEMTSPPQESKTSFYSGSLNLPRKKLLSGYYKHCASGSWTLNHQEELILSSSPHPKVSCKRQAGIWQHHPFRPQGRAEFHDFCPTLGHLRRRDCFFSLVYQHDAQVRTMLTFPPVWKRPG